MILQTLRTPSTSSATHQSRRTQPQKKRKPTRREYPASTSSSEFSKRVLSQYRTSVTPRGQVFQKKCEQCHGSSFSAIFQQAVSGELPLSSESGKPTLTAFDKRSQNEVEIPQLQAAQEARLHDKRGFVVSMKLFGTKYLSTSLGRVLISSSTATKQPNAPSSVSYTYGRSGIQQAVTSKVSTTSSRPSGKSSSAATSQTIMWKAAWIPVSYPNLSWMRLKQIHSGVSRNYLMVFRTIT